jgi:hypothetical protein
MIDRVRSANHRRAYDWKTHLASGLAHTLSLVACLIKHPSFAEEREWRLVSLVENRSRSMLLYRQGQSMIIPYQTVPLGDDRKLLPVRQIYVGPTPHPELAVNSVTGLLAATGHDEIAVERSAVPYRGW